MLESIAKALTISVNYVTEFYNRFRITLGQFRRRFGKLQLNVGFNYGNRSMACLKL